MNQSIISKLYNKINIIALTGLATSGKNTVVDILSRLEKNVVYSFATPVKECAGRYFGWDGKKDERGRKLLHDIGTPTGRAYNPDVWVDYMLRVLNSYYDNSKEKPNTIIIDDLRFDNEAEMVKKLNGIIIKVHNDNVPKLDLSSEQGINENYIDYHIYNNNMNDNMKSLNIDVNTLYMTELYKYCNRLKKVEEN